LKATNSLLILAIEKYLIGRTQFLKEEKLQFFFNILKWSNNHNIATTEWTYVVIKKINHNL